MKLGSHERVLVIKPSSLGDVVHTLPAVAAIRRHRPEARIDWLVNTEWVPLLDGVPFLDEVIPFPRSSFRGLGGGPAALRWARETFAEKSYDLAIDFQGLLRSALLARLSGARGKVGFAHAREGAGWLYDERVPIPDWRRVHAVDRYTRLVESLGVPVDLVEFPLPAGSPPRLDAALPRRPIVIHPFSRGAGKSMAPEEVVELCEALAPHPVVLVGRSNDRDERPGDWPEHVVALLDRTDIAGLIHVLRSADWTISVDSGPMHLAAGLGDRVLSLHTWTDPAMVGPWRKSAWVWRDGRIRQVGELEPGEFPEQRGRKRELESRPRLFSSDEIAEIAAFTLSRRST